MEIKGEMVLIKVILNLVEINSNINEIYYNERFYQLYKDEVSLLKMKVRFWIAKIRKDIVIRL